MLDNFNILASDHEARRIFPELPLVSYRRQRNLDVVLVYSTDDSRVPSNRASTSDVQANNFSDFSARPEERMRTQHLLPRHLSV